MAIMAASEITLSCVVDIKATYRYYLLQSSTLAKPAKPTTFPPPSAWDDTEPSYKDGSTNSLYFVECTVFCDDTFNYSEVSLSSAYEAAKVAYNKAVNAQNTANKLEERVVATEASIKQNAESIELRVTETRLVEVVNDIEIGARNLIRNSNNLIFEGYYFDNDNQNPVTVSVANGVVTLTGDPSVFTTEIVDGVAVVTEQYEVEATVTVEVQNGVVIIT